MRITSALAPVFLALLMVAALPAGAQYGPPGRIAPSAPAEQVLREFISQMQTGTPDASFIGPQLWQAIAAQTNNTGVYPQLVQLGSIRKVEVVARRDLPAGPVYSMKVTHSGGESNWIIGISTISRKLEYASAGFNAAAPTSLPPQPEPPDSSDNTSDACRKFPNLCPK